VRLGNTGWGFRHFVQGRCPTHRRSEEIEFGENPVAQTVCTAQPASQRSQPASQPAGRPAGGGRTCFAHSGCACGLCVWSAQVAAAIQQQRAAHDTRDRFTGEHMAATTADGKHCNSRAISANAMLESQDDVFESEQWGSKH
jgi:hypothetical protein